MGTFFYTSLALIAFAGNSLLCRLALKSMAIDPISFTQLRLLSGSLTLIFLIKIVHPRAKPTPLCLTSKKRWLSAAFLFFYALFFSIAYTSLDAATGALILFTAVQFTLFISHYLSGEKLNRYQWLGSVIAFIGFIYLLLPVAQVSNLWCSLLMLLSGLFWGFYTLVGARSRQPLLDNAHNFALTLPFVLLLFPYNYPHSVVTGQGITLAIVSGALASGVGYAIWYKALRKLTTINASVVQLLVPVIAAAGGASLLSEAITLNLLIAGTLIMMGLLIANLKKGHAL